VEQMKEKKPGLSGITKTPLYASEGLMRPGLGGKKMWKRKI